MWEKTTQGWAWGDGVKNWEMGHLVGEVRFKWQQQSITKSPINKQTSPRVSEKWVIDLGGVFNGVKRWKGKIRDAKKRRERLDTFDLINKGNLVLLQTPSTL